MDYRMIGQNMPCLSSNAMRTALFPLLITPRKSAN